jgi:hypothetical protein
MKLTIQMPSSTSSMPNALRWVHFEALESTF